MDLLKPRRNTWAQHISMPSGSHPDTSYSQHEALSRFIAELTCPMQVGSLERALMDLLEPQRSTWAQHISALLFPLARTSRLVTRLLAARLGLLSTLCSLRDPLCLAHGASVHLREADGNLPRASLPAD